MYFLFGLPSFGIVYLLWQLGMNRLRRQDLKPMGSLFVKVMLAVIGFSVLLEFTIGKVWQFPVGGAIGQYLVSHLTGVLGSFGVVLLLLALFGLYLVFEARIDFNGSPRQIGNDIRDHFSERIRFRGKKRPERFEPKTAATFNTPKEPALAPALAPKRKSSQPDHCRRGRRHRHQPGGNRRE